MLFVIVSVLVVTLLDFQLRVGPHTHFRGLTKTRRADGPDDGSDGMACDGPPAHARVWRASGPSAKTTGRLILYCMFCHVE